MDKGYFRGFYRKIPLRLIEDKKRPSSFKINYMSPLSTVCPFSVFSLSGDIPDDLYIRGDTTF